MKIIRFIITIAAIAFLIWFALSFGEIAFTSPLNTPTEYSSWNLFSILF